MSERILVALARVGWIKVDINFLLGMYLYYSHTQDENRRPFNFFLSFLSHHKSCVEIRLNQTT